MSKAKIKAYQGFAFILKKKKRKSKQAISKTPNELQKHKW